MLFAVTCLQGIYYIYFATNFSTKITNHKKIQRHKLGWHLILKNNYKVFNFFFLKNEPAMTIEKIKMVPKWFISTLTCTTSKNSNELRFFPLHLKWRIRKLSVPNFVSGKKKNLNFRVVLHSVVAEFLIRYGITIYRGSSNDTEFWILKCFITRNNHT